MGAIAGVRVGKYNLGTRAGKWKASVMVGNYKLRARTGKYKLGATAGKCKLGNMVGKYKLGSRAVQRPGIHPKLCGNCAFTQTFHTRTLGEITAFYSVYLNHFMSLL